MFNKTLILQSLLQLLFGMVGALVIQLFFIHQSPHIVTVDITGMVKSFEDEILKQKLSTDEFSQKVQIFGKALNSTLITYSEKNHLILVPKEVVIAGNVDKTDEIKTLIKKRMNP